jgi:hypothetical protein
VGVVTVSTYPTASNNTPYPTGPDAVTNMAWNANSDFSSSVIDRFWQIDKTGASGTATVTYTYAPAEISGSVVGNTSLLYAQRYSSSTNIWQSPRSTQTANAAAYSVTETGITLFSPRMLGVHASVLPIKLLSFSATSRNNKHVDVKWATATENNNGYFLVDRSADGNTFETIAKITGNGNSSKALYYSFVDASPLRANNYYRLKQVDLDGSESYSHIVKAFVNNASSIAVNSTTSGNLAITFTNITEKGVIKIFDAAGKLIYQKRYDGSPLLNVSTTGFRKGVYSITFNKVVNRVIVQ